MSETLPPGWKAGDFGDATQLQALRVGSGSPPTVFSSTKHYGLVPSREFFKGRQIFSDDLAAYRVVERNWFAYATNHLAEGSIGINNTPQPGCVSPMYTVFSAADGIDPAFLYRVLRSTDALAGYGKHEQASVDRRGAIRYSAFARIPVVLPPMKEQLRIAEILDTIDQTIQATERVIAKLGNELFGLIDAFFAKETRLTVLGELTTKMTNGFVGTATPFYTEKIDSAVPYLYGTNVRANLLDFRDLRFVTPTFHASQRKSQLLEDDLVTVQSGHIGTTAVVPAGFSKLNCHALIITRLKPGALLPRYLAEYLNSRTGTHQLNRLFVGSTILHLNVKDFRSLQVPNPDPAEQSSIIESIDRHRSSLTFEQQVLRKLRQQRSGLAADLLSGRVRTAS